MFSRVSRYLNRLDIKLTIYYTSILLVLLFLLSGFFIYRLEKSLVQQIDKILRDEAYEIKMECNQEADLVKGSIQYEEDTAHRSHFPIFFRIVRDSGDVLYASKNLSTFSLPPPKNKTHFFSTLKIPGRKYPLRLYEQKIVANNTSTLTLQLATDAEEFEEILENIDENILSAIPIIVFLSICCGMFASRKPRKIISDITKVSKKITSENLSERLPVPDAHDEIYYLTATINSMLDRLENSFNEIKQFSSDVAHELRNPLFSFKGEMEVTLAKGRTVEEYREVLQVCLERVNFIVKLVSDIFLISRFESNKVDLNFTHFNLSEAIKELYDFFLPMAQDKNLNFVMNRWDNVFINGDATRIYQLFSNLLDNAVKFTPEYGSVALQLTSENNTAHFSIKNSGMGIPENALPYIFNRFYQVDQSRSGTSRGSGLGLSICNKIVEVHRGSITVESNKDEGVTFTVILPKT